MATKLGKMVTYIDGLTPINLHQPLITWSWGITCKLKSLYLYCHRAYDHRTWQAGYLPLGVSTHNVIPPLSLARSRNKLKPLYLHYHNIYGHKTRQCDELLWLPFTHKVKWPYNDLVLWDHMTNKKYCVLHYRNGFGLKTWLDDDLLWVTSAYKVTWPYNHVVL